MAALKVACRFLCCFVVLFADFTYAQTTSSPDSTNQIDSKSKHEFPPIKLGIWSLEITGPSGEKQVHSQKVCDSLDLDFVFMGKFSDLRSGLTEVGLGVESKKVADNQYLITSKTSTQRKGSSIVLHHVTMNGTTAFTDSAETTKQKRVTKYLMEGHWVQECSK